MSKPQHNDENYEYYAETDLSDYAGQYVAIHDNKVQYSSEDLEEVYNWMQENYPEVIPFITQVCPTQVMLL